MDEIKNATIDFPDDELQVKAPLGTSLINIVQVSHADITFGCKKGSCGTCRIVIDSGSENLSTPSREEADFLKLLDAPPNTRLACQVKVLGNCTIRQP